MVHLRAYRELLGSLAGMVCACSSTTPDNDPPVLGTGGMEMVDSGTGGVTEMVDSGTGGVTENLLMDWQPDTSALLDCSDEGRELVEQVNQFRSRNGRPRVDPSPSLCTVARLHVDDLRENFSELLVQDCAAQSWSGDGPVEACCYTSDGAHPECSWNKPRELTEYPSEGFELVAIGASSWKEALDAWTEEEPLRNLLLNAEEWEGTKWKAMGAELLDGHAVVWLGEREDPAIGGNENE